MKGLKITLLILILLTYRGISQTASNNTCIPNEQLKKAINLIEQGKVCKDEVQLLKSKIVQLDSSITNKNKLIAEYQKNLGYQDTIISGYAGVVKNLQKSIANGVQTFALQKEKLKKERYKKWAALTIGVAFGLMIQ